MLKLTRSQLNKQIASMPDTFNATYKVLEEYEAEKKQIQAREQEIKSQLQELQERHLQLVSDRELSKGNVSDFLYLSKQLQSLKGEEKILRSLLEGVEEELTEVKLKYAPLIASSHSKELGAMKAEFNTNEVVEYVRYELIKAIADYAGDLRAENNKLMPLLDDFNEAEVLEVNPQMRHVFNFEASTLPYWQANKTVLHREHIRTACGGAIHPEVKRPKEAK